MTSQLLKPGRRRWTSRATVLAVITAAHVGAIALAMLVRSPPVEREKEVALSVSLFTEHHDETPPPQVRPPDVVIPEVVVPMINVEIRQDLPPPPITVVATPTPPPPSPPAPKVVSKSDSNEPVFATAVEYVRQPVLVYPAAARQVRAAGTAHIRAVVETDGHVREVSVERSSGFASLDKAATEAMYKALFKPYMHNGVAHAAVVIVPMEFALNSRGAKRDKDSRDDHCGKPRGNDRDDNRGRDDHCGPHREGGRPQTVSQAITQ